MWVSDDTEIDGCMCGCVCGCTSGAQDILMQCGSIEFYKHFCFCNLINSPKALEEGENSMVVRIDVYL